MVLKWILLFCLITCGSLSGCSYHIMDQPNVIHQATPRPQYLPIQNGQVEYVRFGNGSPIILINGYSADIASWDERFLAKLATKHDVILFNNRNVGSSCIQSNCYTTRCLANDTYQLIQGLHLKNTAILGYSMGGIIAQQLTVIHPEAVGKLILMSTLIAGYQSVHINKKMRKQLFNLPRNPLMRFAISLQLFFPEGARFEAANALLFHRFIPADYPFYSYPEESILKEQQKLITSWCEDQTVAPKIYRLLIPTLILSGDKDTTVPPLNSRILATNIKSSKWVRWKEGGHAMVFQFPVEIADEINAFLL